MNMPLGPLSDYETLARLVLKMRAKGVEDVALFSALERVPRRLFLPAVFSADCYDNRIIPIECGEYIERLEEQILILAALNLEPKHRVLEIGAGSGFTAAVMSRICGRVTTIERYKTLAELARQRFQSLQIDNVILRQMDGSYVHAQMGPFDRIIIWPSRKDVPQDFLEILSSNGVLIQAIGEVEDLQMVKRFQKQGAKVAEMNLFNVRYQPFIEGVAHVL